MVCRLHYKLSCDCAPGIYEIETVLSPTDPSINAAHTDAGQSAFDSVHGNLKLRINAYMNHSDKRIALPQWKATARFSSALTKLEWQNLQHFLTCRCSFSPCRRDCIRKKTEFLSQEDRNQPMTDMFSSYKSREIPLKHCCCKFSTIIKACSIM
jgi:hypothetical protein